MIYALLISDSGLLTRFMKAQGSPIYAVNLCNFFRTARTGFAQIPDSIYGAVVEQLIQTQGRFLNGNG
jgi:hypothetical protein